MLVCKAEFTRSQMRRQRLRKAKNLVFLQWTWTLDWHISSNYVTVAHQVIYNHAFAHIPTAL